VRLVGLFLGIRLVLPLVRDLRVRAPLVALLGEGDQPGGLQFGQDAPLLLGLLVVDRAGQRSGDPEDVALGGPAMTCRFMPCLPE